MYQNEWLPYALLIGISEERFWKLNPRTIQPYVKAYQMKQEQRDTEMWQMGIYVQQAFGVVISALASSFGKKKSDAKYFEKPLHQQMKEQQQIDGNQLSEEEKIRQTKMFFERLKTMQTNFEIDKKQNN